MKQSNIIKELKRIIARAKDGIYYVKHPKYAIALSKELEDIQTIARNLNEYVRKEGIQ